MGLIDSQTAPLPATNKVNRYPVGPGQDPRNYLTDAEAIQLIQGELDSRNWINGSPPGSVHYYALANNGINPVPATGLVPTGASLIAVVGDKLYRRKADGTTWVQVVEAPGGVLTKGMIWYGCQTISPGGNSWTFYLIPSYDAGQSTVEIATPIPFACTISQLYVSCRLAQSAAWTNAITLRKNRADTAVTCSLVGSVLTASDVTHSAAFAAGDLISFSLVGSTPGGGSSFTDIQVAVQVS